jgi:hypothetical protein
MLEQYRTHYSGWTAKHFHEHLQERHIAGATPGPRRNCTRPAWSSGQSGAGRIDASGRESRARG